MAEYIALRNIQRRAMEARRGDAPPVSDGKAPPVKNPEDRKTFKRG